MAKKPETEIKFTQSPAQGDQADAFHSQDPIDEAKAHGDFPNLASGPNGNQGGN